MSDSPAPFPARAASPGDLREWTFLAWAALADVDRQLRHGAVREASERLDAARSLVRRLWAARHGLPYPPFGQPLPGSAGPVPPGLDATFARSEPVELRRAALALARLLNEQAAEGSARRDTDPTAARADGMAAYVMTRLQAAAD